MAHLCVESAFGTATTLCSVGAGLYMGGLFVWSGRVRGGLPQSAFDCPPILCLGAMP